MGVEPSTFQVVYLILAVYGHPICANRCKSKSLLIDRFVFFLFVLDRRSKSCECMNFVRKIEKTKQWSDTEASKISWVDAKVITNHQINQYISWIMNHDHSSSTICELKKLCFLLTPCPAFSKDSCFRKAPMKRSTWVFLAPSFPMKNLDTLSMGGVCLHPFFHNWLVVEPTQLKKIWSSNWDIFPQIGVKIKHTWVATT